MVFIHKMKLYPAPPPLLQWRTSYHIALDRFALKSDARLRCVHL